MNSVLWNKDITKRSKWYINNEIFKTAYLRTADDLKQRKQIVTNRIFSENTYKRNNRNEKIKSKQLI